MCSTRAVIESSLDRWYAICPSSPGAHGDAVTRAHCSSPWQLLSPPAAASRISRFADSKSSLQAAVPSRGSASLGAPRHADASRPMVMKRQRNHAGGRRAECVRALDTSKLVTSWLRFGNEPAILVSPSFRARMRRARTRQRLGICAPRAHWRKARMQRRSNRARRTRRMNGHSTKSVGASARRRLLRERGSQPYRLGRRLRRADDERYLARNRSGGC